jgi:hypothetical protein
LNNTEHKGFTQRTLNISINFVFIFFVTLVLLFKF